MEKDTKQKFIIDITEQIYDYKIHQNLAHYDMVRDIKNRINQQIKTANMLGLQCSIEYIDNIRNPVKLSIII